MRTQSTLLVTAILLGAVGCGNATVDSRNAGLQRTQTCDDVLQAFQSDALAKVDLEVTSFVDQEYFGGVTFGGGVLEGDVGMPVPASSPDDGRAEDPSGVSDTNRQVAGVDEADIVKVGDDGHKLYVIRNNGFYEFDSWPASQTSKVADIAIEGYVIEMFVHDDRAVVFSNVYGLEGVDDTDSCGGGVEPLPGRADIAYPYYCGRSYVKVTSIDLTGDELVSTRELYFEGWYLSSRRHTDLVRAVVQSHIEQPASVPYLWDHLNTLPSYPETRAERATAANTWAKQAKAAIVKTGLSDWLPVQAERVGGEVTELTTQCDGFYAPAPGLTNYGMTQIIGFDSQDDEGPLHVAAILGSASQVYANADAMVLAQPEWAWSARGGESNRTAVHRFSILSGSPMTLYGGSGFVPGYVEDQFSIDERDGVLRLATTRTTWTGGGGGFTDEWVPPVTDNLVTTMALEGGELIQLGQTPAMAEGERIFSARFLGDIGYIVTFRQVDPLFAIDLSDPTQPTVLGELKIPGFSDYMHPLGDDHLLTIGRDVDEVTQQDNGTALQIFDVSDPTEPALSFKTLVGQGYSEANHNHKAFNFYADKSVLAFPFVNYQSSISSTLELWRVDAQTGFDRLGAVDHSDLITEDCPDWTYPDGEPFEADAFYRDCGYLPQISRGVFIDEYIYSISHGGVLVHNLDDLVDPVATATY